MASDFLHAVRFGRWQSSVSLEISAFTSHCVGSIFATIKSMRTSSKYGGDCQLVNSVCKKGSNLASSSRSSASLLSVTKVINPAPHV